MTLDAGSPNVSPAVRHPKALSLAVLLAALAPGCRSMATGALADALSSSSGSYGQDDDPELIAAAVPFGLKTMEGVLAEKPDHRGLLTALAAGFTQYGYAFVEQEADTVAAKDLARALEIKVRARKLYLRAKGYAIRGLEVDHPGVAAGLKANPDQTLAQMTAEDVPLLYWLAASWGLAISTAKNDPDLVADFPLVVKIAMRALALDEAWNRGSIHELFITLDAARPGGSLESARRHFDRAVELSGGLRAGPYVSLAESVAVKAQDSATFHAMLAKALAVDPDKSPEDRLSNVIMQRRAQRLKAASADLFLEDTQ